MCKVKLKITLAQSDHLLVFANTVSNSPIFLCFTYLKPKHHLWHCSLFLHPHMQSSTKSDRMSLPNMFLIWASFSTYLITTLLNVSSFSHLDFCHSLLTDLHYPLCPSSIHFLPGHKGPLEMQNKNIKITTFQILEINLHSS